MADAAVESPHRRRASRNSEAGSRLVSQFGLIDSSNFHQVALEAAFQSCVTMDRNGNAGGDSRFGVDVVAAADPLQLPPSRLKKPTESFATDGLHTAISITLSFSEMATSWTSTDRQPSTAS